MNIKLVFNACAARGQEAYQRISYVHRGTPTIIFASQLQRANESGGCNERNVVLKSIELRRCCESATGFLENETLLKNEIT
jgi:hypothetical protein